MKTAIVVCICLGRVSAIRKDFDKYAFELEAHGAVSKGSDGIKASSQGGGEDMEADPAAKAKREAEKEQEKLRRCKANMDETIRTERAFRDVLGFLADQVAPVLHSGWLKRHAEALKDSSSRLLDALALEELAQADRTPTAFVQAFNRMLADMERPFTTWALEYGEVEYDVTQMKKYEISKQLLQGLQTRAGEVLGATNRLEVPAFLIQPVQRVMRYVLLMNEITKNCEAVTEADGLTQVQAFADVIDALRGARDERRTLLGLRENYPEGKIILDATRHIVNDYPIEKLTDKFMQGKSWVGRRLVLTDTHVLMLNGAEKFKAFALRDVKRELLKFLGVEEGGALPSLEVVKSKLLSDTQNREEWNDKLFWKLPVPGKTPDEQKIYNLREPNTNIASRKAVNKWVELIYKEIEVQ